MVSTATESLDVLLMFQKSMLPVDVRLAKVIASVL